MRREDGPARRRHRYLLDACRAYAGPFRADGAPMLRAFRRHAAVRVGRNELAHTWHSHRILSYRGGL